MNAYDDGDAVVLDAARFPRMLFMNPDAADDGHRNADMPKLHRWRLDRRTGALKSTPLDDRVGEFPRVDERRLGDKHRFGYMAGGDADEEERQLLFTAVHKYDLERGRTEVRTFGRGNGVGEPLFVPRMPDAAEDDGYVLVLAYDRTRNSSEFLILDARDITAEPIATVRLPHRVPYGFHGNWVPAAA